MTHSLHHSSNSNHSPVDHALVIGGGMAGLIAARILSETFEDVTIVDRTPRAGSVVAALS